MQAIVSLLDNPVDVVSLSTFSDATARDTAMSYCSRCRAANSSARA